MKYIRPISVSRSKGLLAKVYQMINEDFAPAGRLPGGDPASLHSLHPTLMFTWWGAMRETVLVKEAVPRNYKESIAAAISLSNDCSFCVDQHSAILRALGDRRTAKAIPICDLVEVVDKKQMQLIYWALSHQSKEAHFVRNPPFNFSEAPEIIGTATIVNYINRLVEVFLKDSIMSVRFELVRSVLRRVSAFFFKSKGNLATKPRLMDDPDDLSEDDLLKWCKSNRRIALSWEAFLKEVNMLGNKYLSENLKTTLFECFEMYVGSDEQYNPEPLQKRLQGDERSVGEYLCKVALEPEKITKHDVRKLRNAGYDDSGILAITSWASLNISLRISQWLWQGLGRSQVNMQLM